MSYEGKMLEQLEMPTRKQVEQALLHALLKHGGAIKEFGSGQEIVDEIADSFKLNESQRSAFLETVYRKENRVKKSLLWHRLLFRAADLSSKRESGLTSNTNRSTKSKKRMDADRERIRRSAKVIKHPCRQKEFFADQVL